MKFDFGHQKFRVLLNAVSVAVLKVSPQFAHLGQQRSVPHRVLAAQIVSLSQQLVQQMAELPGRDPVVLERLPCGHCPERVSALAVKRADDRRSGVLHL